MVKYTQGRTVTDICRKCGGQFAHIHDSKERQEQVLKTFGQIGSNCPPGSTGNFPCPYLK